MTTPQDAQVVPRYTGITTFYRLPVYEKKYTDKKLVGIVGVPFDGGCTYRTGARFGPQSVRSNSVIFRPYSLFHQKSPFHLHECVDVGDLNTNPFKNSNTVDLIHNQLNAYYQEFDHLFMIGGDHTITYPVLKSVHEKYGRVNVIHFDSHYDTWDGYFEEKVTHGTPFRRVFEENLINVENSIHVGIRGTVAGPEDVEMDKKIGFSTVYCHEKETLGLSGIIDKVKKRVGNQPTYISIDVDVVDPAFAPGTGTPECGGFSSSEMLTLLRGLKGIQLIGGDVVEVSPPYDTQSGITAQLAATLCYEMLCLL